MNDLIVVTGKMRSGTSLAASILHRLGWCAGTYISAPMPPSWRSDWEDAWSVDLIVGSVKPTFFKDWIKSRREIAGLFGFQKILLKSPYLALYMERLRPFDPFVIHTKRDSGEVRASMSRHPMLDEKDQKKIEKALSVQVPNYIFDTDRCQEDPRSEIQALCMALGFDPGTDLEAVIALVDQKKAEVF